MRDIIVKILETEKMFSVNFSQKIENKLIKRIVGYLSKTYKKKVLLVDKIYLHIDVKDGKVIGYVETRKGKGSRRIVNPKFEKYYRNLGNKIVTQYVYDILTLEELLKEMERMRNSSNRYNHRFEFLEVEDKEKELISA